MYKYLTLIALFGLLFVGGAAAATVIEEIVVVFTGTEEHAYEEQVTVSHDGQDVVVTVRGTISDTDAYTTTVLDTDEIPDPPTTSTTVPTTTTTPTPQPGTTLYLLAQQFRCTQPITALANNGLPLHVIVDSVSPWLPAQNAGAAWLGPGCIGDGTPATDIVLNIRGDGVTHGPGDDAIRLAVGNPGASNLDITGVANCGPRMGAAHQDGVQVLGGTNVNFINFNIGDYDGERATCQGAGGAFFYSGDSNDVNVVGGKYIACNHGLLAGWASPGADVTDASFRTAPAPICVQQQTFQVSQPCDIRSAWGGVATNLTCQRWVNGAWVG